MFQLGILIEPDIMEDIERVVTLLVWSVLSNDKINCCPPIMRTTAAWPRNIKWINRKTRLPFFGKKYPTYHSFFKLLGYVGGHQVNIGGCPEIELELFGLFYSSAPNITVTVHTILDM